MPSQSLSHRPKPLLRGASHAIAVWFTLGASVLLARRAASDRAAVAAVVYGATLISLFAVSAIYHRVTWSPPARAVMRRLDHAAIFLLIAGTYTPLCLLLGGTRGSVMLAAIWAGAGLGIVQSMFWISAPKALVTALCVALGWMAVAVVRELGASVGAGGIALLVAGGLLYSAGAVVYALRRPDPAPAIFGYHEIFHALVIAAATCHFVVVASAVAALS
jgi:hemolysin III